MSDLIDRQVAISAICNACGKIDCDKTDKCEKLQLPPANSSEIPNSSDTISRAKAIDALDEQIEKCDKSLSSFDISMKDAYAVKVERASLVAFREILEYLLSAQPEIIRCRKCKFASGDSRICMKFGHSPIGELDFCAWAERRTDG